MMNASAKSESAVNRAAIPTLPLSDIQQKFADALLSLNALDQAVPMLKVRAVGNQQVSDVELAQHRLAFYRGSLTAIWKQTLSNTFPVLLQLVGDEFFEQLARAYGRAHPSQSGNLNLFGAELASFVAGNEHCADYPYFVDVIRLEWLVHQTFYAKDSASIGLSEVLSHRGEAFSETRLQWNTNAHLFQSDWDAVSIWLAHQEEAGEGIEINLEQPSYGVVTRPNWRVQVTALSQSEFLALQALKQSAAIGAALEIAVEQDPNFDIPAKLNQWFDIGLFSDIQAD